MQILINIPDEKYERLLYQDIISLRSYVENGIVLPKEHGRLIDADELYGDFIDGTEGYDCQTWNRIEIGDVIEYAPTIIEADRSEQE